MTRVAYEIGARGTDTDTTALRKNLRDDHGYYGGRFHEETVKSVYTAKWLDSGETVLDFTRKLTGWCAEWSKKYPEAEVFWFLTDQSDRDSGLRYATFRDGEFYRGATIIQHGDFVSEFGDCDCTTRETYFGRYPEEAPFVDCPVRLNPPTEWAVERIMDASEYIGVRR